MSLNMYYVEILTLTLRQATYQNECVINMQTQLVNCILCVERQRLNYVLNCVNSDDEEVIEAVNASS